ncbi:hypothetical protein RhiirA5_419893 [Rhizophagus irregularis]|uniref:Uncharacterized protein n=1 Tax=Rhizophagus irregularis TaxID=588596 RepID=A0A2I1ECS3_9GLOM|nr:hypothetical protein RhiirA5_419893 [Rhizophagus irregularis]PKY19938.1 hypothetical protein RhiirB3_433117 [Rhizophagus irregularis]
MTSSQPAVPTQTANDTITDTNMEEASSSSPIHVLSHSEIELTSRDLQEKDFHTQTPITDKLTNMDVDPIVTNTDKGKLPETQSATQIESPNPLQITVLTDIFKKAAKNRYNLRGNKQGNITADDSEQPLATDEDTDVPDDAVMSDGAVFEGIIDELSNTSPSEPKFSVKSYNPLNLLPQFNVTR